MPETTTVTNANDGFLANIVAQSEMVRTQTSPKPEEQQRLTALQEQKKLDAQKLIREFLAQVSDDAYYKATLANWYEKTDDTLAEKFAGQPVLQEHARDVVKGNVVDVVAAIKTRIAQIDDLLQLQLDTILHDDNFQA